MSAVNPATPPLRVLFVEDNDDLREIIGILLEEEGLDVCPCASAEEAETLFSQRPFDMVLTYVSLPKMSGNEVCQRFRQNEWGRQMTVIALTGWGQEQDRRQTTESGFDLHLVKPADPVALLKLLEGISA